MYNSLLRFLQCLTSQSKVKVLKSPTKPLTQFTVCPASPPSQFTAATLAFKLFCLWPLH